MSNPDPPQATSATPGPGTPPALDLVVAGPHPIGANTDQSVLSIPVVRGIATTWQENSPIRHTT